jgi:Na+-translocating ferredoxin:NAD+ oxidoreductase RNF subunit RnfB
MVFGMETIITAIIATAAIGFACAALIAVASKLMFVKVDERVEKIRACLPGANCGACGFSGCDGYAEALVKGEAASNLCPPGGDEAYGQINKMLGIGAGEGLVKKLAIVHCMGDSEKMCEKMEYVGINTCFAAKQLYGGQGACTFGCIGLGDCVAVCPSAAICMENNLARIDPRKCSGCEVCVKVCPTGVIAVEKVPIHVAVMCKNTEKGAKLKDKCSVGCIGCMRCAKVCHTEAITINESLAVIDYSKCDGCEAGSSQSDADASAERHKCAGVCVKGCISISNQ